MYKVTYLCITIISANFVIINAGQISRKTVCNTKTNPCQCEEWTSPRQIPSARVDCSRRDIWTFPDSNTLPIVTDYLDLSHNKLVELPKDVKFISETLRELRLEHNQLTKLPANFFKSMPYLEHLDLSHNEISVIEFDALQGLANLKVLNIAANRITDFPLQLFRPLINLRSLWISNNDIGQNLKMMDAFGEVKLGLSRNLTELEMENIGIDEFDEEFFKDAEQLKRLSLARNPLKKFPRLPQSLKFLDLSETSLEKVTSEDLMYHDLKTLHLNKMALLKSIDDYAFYNLPSLQRLEISECFGLTELSRLAFGEIVEGNVTIPTSLKRLILSRNGLGTIDKSYYELFKQIDTIGLNGNPWTCNCNILWMHRLENDQLHKRNDTRCRFPWSLKNRLLFELTDKDLPCNSSIYKALLPVLGSLVAILIVLIAYLIYMGPFTYKKYLYISQESPYHGMTIQPIRTVN